MSMLCDGKYSGNCNAFEILTKTWQKKLTKWTQTLLTSFQILMLMWFTFVEDQTFMTPLITHSKSSFIDELIFKNRHN